MRSIASLVVVAGLLASCAADRNAETVLVTRVDWPFEAINIGDDTWRVSAEELTLRDADGNIAVIEPFVKDERVEFQLLLETEQPCDQAHSGRTQAMFVSYPETSGEQSYSVRFADGGVATLFPESAISLDAGGCFDEIGRWEGVAGSFNNRSGSYRFVQGEVQTELVLTES